MTLESLGIAFPLLHLVQASVQNSAIATFLQGGPLTQQEKKEIQKKFPAIPVS
jgi:hypothetical protein